MQRNTRIIVYPLIFSIFSVIFLLSFRSPFFSNQKVLFYRGIELLVMTTVATLIVTILVFRKQWKFKLETIVSALIFTFSIHLSFFVIFPVTFDRSVTMYLLETLKQRGNSESCQGLSEEQLEEVFIKEYIRQNQAVNRRINEQLFIDFIKRHDQCVQLTDRGNKFLRLSEMITKIYALNQNNKN